MSAGYGTKGPQLDRRPQPVVVDATMSLGLTMGYVQTSNGGSSRDLGALPARGSRASNGLHRLGWPDEPGRLRHDWYKPSACGGAWYWTDNSRPSVGLGTSEWADTKGSANRSPLPQSRLFERAPFGGCYRWRKRPSWTGSRDVGATITGNSCRGARSLSDTLQAWSRAFGGQYLYRPQRLSWLQDLSARRRQIHAREAS